MDKPHLTFFVELERVELTRLFANGQAEDWLTRGGFGLALGILDLAAERAAIIRGLEHRGIPVTAWLLLPQSDGYWLNADNADMAAERYRAVHAWARAEELSLSWIGLGIELPRAVAARRLLRALLRAERLLDLIHRPSAARFAT